MAGEYVHVYIYLMLDGIRIECVSEGMCSDVNVFLQLEGRVGVTPIEKTWHPCKCSWFQALFPSKSSRQHASNASAFFTDTKYKWGYICHFQV